MPFLTLQKSCFRIGHCFCVVEWEPWYKTFKTLTSIMPQLHSKFFMEAHVYFTNKHSEIYILKEGQVCFWTKPLFPVLDFCLCFTLTGSGGISVLWTYSSIFYMTTKFLGSSSIFLCLTLTLSSEGIFYYTPAPRRGRGVYCFTSVRPSVLPSVQDIFRRIFLSNC
jgi:hypothetical protein